MSYRSKHCEGMSLLETMIAMVIFMMLALGISSSVFQSMQISQNNVLRNTAFTVAQGYLEQIKSLSLSEVRSSIADPSGTPLPTMSISALANQNIEISDPLYLDGPDRSLSGQTDGSNFREILIDLKSDEDSENTREVTMEGWFDIDISELENRSHSFAITVSFEASLRGTGQRVLSGQLRGIRSDINRSRTP